MQENFQTSGIDSFVDYNTSNAILHCFIAAFLQRKVCLDKNVLI